MKVVRKLNFILILINIIMVYFVFIIGGRTLPGIRGDPGRDGLPGRQGSRYVI